MKKLYYIIGVAVVVALAACHTYKDPENPDALVVAEGSEQEWRATMTIGEFFDSDYYKEFSDEQYPARPRSHKGDDLNQEDLGLFSVNIIPDSIILVGRVMSTDVPGNIYKALYIQDCANPDYALKIGVDAGSLGGQYPIGQKIAIQLKGLAIGKYAMMPQLGVPYYNNAKDGMDDAGKAGWEIGRIPPQVFKERVQVIGKPDPSMIVVKEMTIAEIKATPKDYKSIAKLTSRLVRIKDIHFVDKTWNNNALKDLSGTLDCATDGDACTFAPTTGGIGYPQSRCFTPDAEPVAENTMAIGTSEYAKFACAPLPGSSYVGSVEGFVSFYEDRGRYYGTSPNKVWSLTINGLESLKLEDENHDVWRADDVYYPAY